MLVYQRVIQDGKNIWAILTCQRFGRDLHRSNLHVLLWCSQRWDIEEARTLHLMGSLLLTCGAGRTLGSKSGNWNLFRCGNRWFCDSEYSSMFCGILKPFRNGLIIRYIPSSCYPFDGRGLLNMQLPLLENHSMTHLHVRDTMRYHMTA